MPPGIITDTDEVEILSVIRVMKQVVAEAGQNFVYDAPEPEPVHLKACVYAYEGRPSCLVGRVLAKMGVPIETLESFGHEDIGSLTGDPRVPLGAATVHVLALAQNLQDNRVTWGVCLLKAMSTATDTFGVHIS
jgi:hypothetical protein